MFLKICFDCHSGIMKKIFRPRTFDFNEDGWVPLVCDNCGMCSDQKPVVRSFGTVSTVSKRVLHTILDKICYGGIVIDYKTKKSLYHELKNKSSLSVNNLANDIVEYAKRYGVVVGTAFVEQKIYEVLGELGNRSLCSYT